LILGLVKGRGLDLYSVNHLCGLKKDEKILSKDMFGWTNRKTETKLEKVKPSRRGGEYSLDLSWERS
jgi:hypothetical protein